MLLFVWPLYFFVNLNQWGRGDLIATNCNSGPCRYFRPDVITLAHYKKQELAPMARINQLDTKLEELGHHLEIDKSEMQVSSVWPVVE